MAPSQVPKIESQPSHPKYPRKITVCLEEDIENSNILQEFYMCIENSLYTQAPKTASKNLS